MSKNDVTGDNISSKANSPEFNKGYELAFGKDKQSMPQKSHKSIEKPSIMLTFDSVASYESIKELLSHVLNIEVSGDRHDHHSNYNDTVSFSFCEGVAHIRKDESLN